MENKNKTQKQKGRSADAKRLSLTSDGHEDAAQMQLRQTTNRSLYPPTLDCTEYPTPTHSLPAGLPELARKHEATPTHSLTAASDRVRPRPRTHLLPAAQFDVALFAHSNYCTRAREGIGVRIRMLPM